MASRATRAGYTTDGYDDDSTGYDRARARPAVRKGNRRQRAERRPGREPRWEPPPAGRRGPSRAARQGTESFKCGHCRSFIGPTVGGGRHRNHCPLCLYSRHVDDRRPGDRAGGCRSLMAPVARFDRPGGEPAIVHRCLGCGFERHNRLAADDNITLLTRLPLVAPRTGRAAAREEDRQVS